MASPSFRLERLHGHLLPPQRIEPTAVSSIPEIERHPCTRHWQFPPSRSMSQYRVNLRELAARPGRFEHHLMVVARIGSMQLEIATAGDGTPFSHVNISDEFSTALPTGDELVDGILGYVVISTAKGRDLAIIKHGAGHMVRHPQGLLHWPGRLRPPFPPVIFPEGMRRCVLALVMCACQPTPSSPELEPLVSSGLAQNVKLFAGEFARWSAQAHIDAENEVPTHLVDLNNEVQQVVARVSDVCAELLIDPSRVAPPQGGYLCVLSVHPSYPLPPQYFSCDLVFIPPGQSLDFTGVNRALLFFSPTTAASPPPESWYKVPVPPFLPFEDAPPGSLPYSNHGVHVTAGSDSANVSVRVGDGEPTQRVQVPRFWLAKFLFRLALHDFNIGYLETYGGFYYSDNLGKDLRVGTLKGGEVRLDREAMAQLVETMYRAVAPRDFRENPY